MTKKWSFGQEMVIFVERCSISSEKEKTWLIWLNPSVDWASKQSSGSRRVNLVKMWLGTDKTLIIRGGEGALNFALPRGAKSLNPPLSPNLQ